jgi:hypothetical protein
LDWAHWGLTSGSSFNHKSGVAQRIGNIVSIGGVAPAIYLGHPTSFNWNDGVPVANAATTNGVYVRGTSNGFRITIPADLSPHILRLYVGVSSARALLQATLDDGRTSPLVDSSLNSSAGFRSGLYAISYRGGSAGQTLNVRFTMLMDYGSGAVMLQAASLS